ERCVAAIRDEQRQARESGQAHRPRWPMIVLRTPKGWTGPAQWDGHAIEGSWRSHQVPLSDVHNDLAQLKALEAWLRSYQPETLFDDEGCPLPWLLDLAPVGERRMGANPHANGGRLRKPLRLPDFKKYGVDFSGN